MSAAGRSAAAGTGHVREELDFYETPSWATRAILPHLSSSLMLTDPCAGRGAILDVAAASGKWVRVEGFEIEDGRAAICLAKHHLTRCRDALSDATWGAMGHTILTNPPFKLAVEIIDRSLREVGPKGEAAFLLRAGFLGSAERVAFLRAHPCDIGFLSRRPSFCASITCKKDKGGCGWHVTQFIDDPRPKACPACGRNKLVVTTSDSSEYGWYIYSSRSDRRFFFLDDES